MLNTKSKAAYTNIKLIAFVVAALVLAFAIYKFSASDGSRFYKDSAKVATVNGSPIYELEADNIVSAVLANSDKQISYKDLDEKSKNMIIREVAAQRAMLKEAKNKGIKADGDIKRKVHEFKNKLILDAFLSKFVTPEVTPEKIRAKYDEIEKNVKGKQQIKVSHILLNSEDDAKSVLERLKKEPFAKVAKESSLDSSNKDKGGELGYLLAGTMDPDFEKAALALKTGEVSGPVKTKFGWHIIKLDEKKAATIAPFETLKPRLAQDMYSEALKKYADSLLADVKIELVDDATKKKETEPSKAEGNKEKKAEAAKPVKKDKKEGDKKSAE